MTTTTQPIGKMIFHVPFPLNHKAISASGIRPLKMLKAFTDIGYTVDIVEGNSKKRKSLINSIKAEIKAGRKYDFLYSESSTMPTLLTESHHLPLAPMLDFSFFSFLKRHHIPIGLFYRDIYWLFDEYKTNLPFWKYFFAVFFYRYDLIKYNNFVKKLYLPSTLMARYVPTVSPHLFDSLPPGHQEEMEARENFHPDNIRLLYIGGLGAHYQMHELFKALRHCPKVTLTLCTRKSEWLSLQDEYCPQGVPKNITIVHKSGTALAQIYKTSDLAVILVKPFEYWNFAAPVKLYEYIGHGKPIIASEDTLVGQFVKDNNIGWTIPYQSSSIQSLLKTLQNNKQLITAKLDALRNITHQHSWKKRAEKVTTDLCKKTV